ncbi:MAG: HAMP domain-containing sensor histidine kinase [Alphaproteobacteria bacterium]|nr:HAMP domain-containing sensor histidine kinase [Alphaproteobacteria bacterium]
MDSESAKTRFLTAIGHDMRQPLHALLLYLSALERRVKDGEAREILNKADRAAQSLAGMIEGLIQLARLDANKVEPELERVSLKALFDDLIASTPHAAADTTELYVHSDPVLLETIVQQLVANAAKHGGGSAHLSAEEKDGAVEIKVRDSGPGIPTEDQERIFAEFVRLNGSDGGLGLGLTIANKLAALMNHKMEVRSAPGQGATFIVRAERA